MLANFGKKKNDIYKTDCVRVSWKLCEEQFNSRVLNRSQHVRMSSAIRMSLDRLFLEQYCVILDQNPDGFLLLRCGDQGEAWSAMC